MRTETGFPITSFGPVQSMARSPLHSLTFSHFGGKIVFGLTMLRRPERDLKPRAMHLPLRKRQLRTQLQLFESPAHVSRVYGSSAE